MSKKKKSGKKTALKVIGIILAVVVVFVGVYAALMAWTPAATTYSGEINPYILLMPRSFPHIARAAESCPKTRCSRSSHA